MKVLFGVIVALAMSATVQAQQVALKGHPTKTVYASPAEFPVIDGQGHWCPGGAIWDGEAQACVPGGTNPRRFSHAHNFCAFPAYGKLASKIRIQCGVMLFRFDGFVNRIDWGGGNPNFRQPLYDSVIWEDTGTNQAPPMVGDPTGLRMWRYTIEIDPAVSWGVGNGAVVFSVVIETRFNHGDTMSVQHLFPFWLYTDPNAPEVPTTRERCLGGDANYLYEAHTVDVGTTSARGISPDSQIFRLCSYLPLDHVVVAPWKLHTENGRYGNTALKPQIPKGFSELRQRVSLHTDVEGDLIEKVESVNGWDGAQEIVKVHDFYIDPARLNAGPNKVMGRWGLPLPSGPNSPGLAGNEEAQVIFTFDVIGAGATPQPDADGDGVADANDHCPGTPAGTTVDAMGCPVAAPLPVSAFQSLMNQAKDLAQQWPEPIRSQLLSGINALLALIGG